MNTALDFLELELERFRSFIERQSIIFSDYPWGLHFLRGENRAEPRLGSNGAGKSTLFDALCWVLYGKTVSGLRGPDLKPWFGKKQPTRVKLWLRRGKTEHVIERTANPNFLSLDGKEASQDDIEQLVGMNFETFVQTILFGQGRALFFDKSNSDRLKLLSDVLELDRWDDRSKFAADRVATSEREYANVQGEETGTLANLAQLKTQIEDAKARTDNWTRDRTQQLKQLDGKIRVLLDTVEDQTTKLGTAQTDEDGALTELRSCEDDLSKLRNRHAQLVREEAQVITNAHVAKRDLDKLQRELDNLDTTKHCPTCGQKVTKANLEEHRDDILARIVNLERASHTKAISDAAKSINKLNTQINTLETSRRAFRTSADNATAKVRLLTPVLATSQSELKLTREEHAKLDKGANPHFPVWQELLRRRDKTNDDLAAIRADLEALTERIERSKYWVKGFKDVRLFIIEELLSELEVATNAILEEVGLIGWQVRYDTEKDTKSGTVQRGLIVSILSPTNKEAVRWECWSGGEGQRLRAAGALALAEVLLGRAGVVCNIEILDEPTRHLSAEGVEDMCEFLADRAKQFKKQIWYVDHAAVESAKFASVVTVIKTKDGSYIETN